MRLTTPVVSDDSTPDHCQAIDGIEYDVHQHALGVLDVATGEWSSPNGEPYCVIIPWRAPDCPPGCEDHHRIPGGQWIHRSPTLDQLAAAQ